MKRIYTHLGDRILREVVLIGQAEEDCTKLAIASRITSAEEGLLLLGLKSLKFTLALYITLTEARLTYEL
jgi:hypothetical protein